MIWFPSVPCGDQFLECPRHAAADLIHSQSWSSIGGLWCSGTKYTYDSPMFKLNVCYGQLMTNTEGRLACPSSHFPLGCFVSIKVSQEAHRILGLYFPRPFTRTQRKPDLSFWKLCIVAIHNYNEVTFLFSGETSNTVVGELYPPPTFYSGKHQNLAPIQEYVSRSGAWRSQPKSGKCVVSLIKLDYIFCYNPDPVSCK